MIAAVDASTSIFGVAWRCADGGAPEAVAIRRLHESGMSLRRTATERVWPRLSALHAQEPITVLAVEVPPEKWKDDGTGRAQRQAAIGVPLGRAMMLVESWAYTNGVEIGYVPNGVWRQSLRASAWARALPSPPAKPRIPEREMVTRLPPTRRPGGGWVFAFTGCEHTLSASTLTEVQATVDKHKTCPTCTKVHAPVNDPLAHKRPWVELAARAWPRVVEALASDARSRSDRVDAPVHTLAGVADGCDALLLLQHVWQERAQPG